MHLREVYILEKAFWAAIKANDFQVPDGYAPGPLTEDLVPLLGSPDSELRDSLAYEILATWVERGLYTARELEGLASQMMANLEVAVGEQETDFVFLRSFSALILAEIIAYDGKGHVLRAETPELVLEAAERYLASERDLRGFIHGKGWAHSVAHTADLLDACAGYPGFGRLHLNRILTGIAAKITSPTEYAYSYGEGERLAGAVLSVVRRGLVPAVEFGGWAIGVAEKTPKMDSAGKRFTHQNVRGFLTSLYAMLCFRGLAESDVLRPALTAVLPWWFPKEGQ